MGCFSSKFVTSSTSFQEELSRSMRKRNKGFPGFEELFVSKNGTEQLLTVLPEKPQPTTHAITEPSDIIINSWELMEGLEEQATLDHAAKQSKSLNGSASGLQSSLESDVNVGRYRSFHTVEDYDAMMERNRLLDKEEEEFALHATKRSKSLNGLAWSLQSSLESDVNVGRCRSFHTVEDYDTMMERNRLLDKEEEELALKNDSNTKMKHGAHHTEEKITRRLSMAKELPLLILPSTKNIPGVVGKSMEQNESALPVYEEYVTPKFGCFTSLFPVADKSVFDPEILFAFEEEMQDLEQEEETLLKQITAELDVDGSNEINKETSVQVLV